MGVPALFRWLSKKYPRIISPVVEDDGDAQYGRVPQYLDPNPNGELDNLYLDMNGIVHPCSHPEHKPAPETEDEMFLDIFKYTDRVLMMARPRKVLMIAVDGVAPRAKMNQQRARRFRAAQEAQLQDEEKARQIEESESRGQVIDAAIKGKKKWDSNAITPGTPFMDGLAAALKYWVAYKLACDPGWRDLQVIISDATVPGEGEHKLMGFIRSQRLDPQHDPNTRHCIYGLDADLIFLGLATHEPHFRVLREDVFAQLGRQMRVHEQLSMTAEQKEALDAQDARKPFLWLHVNVLREYLEVELNVRMLIQWDLERALDDWVFMCFFVGNDFLPHLPLLSVRDNGIDILVNCWKQVMPKLRDYITCDGRLNIEAVEQLLAGLAMKEDDIFRKRAENERRYQNNDKRRRYGQQEEANMRKQFILTVSKGKEKAPVTADTNMPLMDTSGKLVDGYAQLLNKDIVQNRDVITKANMANADAATALKKLLAEKAGTAESETEKDSETADTEEESSKKRPISDDEDDEDPVRTWESGYRERYYKTKFHVSTEEEVTEIRQSVVRSYIEGISWALLYYYQGCPSWNWYYPFHYAPFAADFTELRTVVGEQGIQFSKGTPFSPYEQLMAVLPAASGHNLPRVFRDLMSNPTSEIIDFYPVDFKIDMNGAKMSWQGIALLPFIDEDRLLTSVRGQYHLLTDAEIERNTNKTAQLFISKDNKNYQRFVDAFGSDEPVAFAAHKSGLAGIVRPVKTFNESGELLFPLKEGEMPHIKNSAYLQAWYDFPVSPIGKSMLLNGYIPHDKVLDEHDKYAITSRQRNNPRFQNTSNYVNNGPSGTKDFLAFSMRGGGYRALLEGGPPKPARNNYPNGNGGRNGGNYNQGNYNQGNNYGNNYGNNNGGYNGGNGGYNNRNNYQGNRGQNGGLNYNQGYGNNHNQGQGNYNQGYNNHNQGQYGSQYGNQNNGHGYNNNNNRGGASRSGYMPPRGHRR